MAHLRPIPSVRTTDLQPAQGVTQIPASHMVRRRALITPKQASYKWWAAATVMLSAFLVVVSGTSLNVALPPMMTAFGLNIDQAQ